MSSIRKNATVIPKVVDTKHNYDICCSESNCNCLGMNNCYLCSRSLCGRHSIVLSKKNIQNCPIICKICLSDPKYGNIVGATIIHFNSDTFYERLIKKIINCLSFEWSRKYTNIKPS
jgi:hypothetical protein